MEKLATVVSDIDKGHAQIWTFGVRAIDFRGNKTVLIHLGTIIAVLLAIDRVSLGISAVP